MIRIAIVVFSVAVWAGPVSAQTKEDLAHARATYESRCISCHQPPDLSFKTDLAWLDQVNRTN